MGAVHEILGQRIEALESMLRRCHAAIRCDDNERLARGEPARWLALDEAAAMVLGDGGWRHEKGG